MEINHGWFLKILCDYAVESDLNDGQIIFRRIEIENVGAQDFPAGRQGIIKAYPVSPSGAKGPEYTLVDTFALPCIPAGDKIPIGLSGAALFPDMLTSRSTWQFAFFVRGLSGNHDIEIHEYQIMKLPQLTDTIVGLAKEQQDSGLKRKLEEITGQLRKGQEKNAESVKTTARLHEQVRNLRGYSEGLEQKVAELERKTEGLQQSLGESQQKLAEQKLADHVKSMEVMQDEKAEDAKIIDKLREDAQALEEHSDKLGQENAALKEEKEHLQQLLTGVEQKLEASVSQIGEAPEQRDSSQEPVRQLEAEQDEQNEQKEIISPLNEERDNLEDLSIVLCKSPTRIHQ